MAYDIRLPNITGYSKVAVGSAYSGALSTASDGGDIFDRHDQGGWGHAGTIYFNAANSSDVYSGDGTNTKIQQQAVKVLYYIVVAEAIKSPVHLNINKIVTDLNNKVDVNLTNVNQTGRDNIMSWTMPDYANGVSKISNTQYTADRDGYLYLYSQGGDQSLVYNTLVIDGVTFENRHQNSGYTTFFSNTLFMPIHKGSVYTATCTTCIFYPLKGSDVCGIGRTDFK